MALVMPSLRVSRPSSMTWLVDTLSPKNSPATSGNWWASSKMMVLQAGSSSPMPSSLSITSAKNRWWLTTTTSAASASWRAAMTKQPLASGHSWPRQFSRVEVARPQAPESSGTSMHSALSPVRVRSVKRAILRRCAASSREASRPALIARSR